MSNEKKRFPLHSKILIGLIAGVLSGIAVNFHFGPNHVYVKGLVHHVTEPIGTLFLRLLLMVVVPLVFSSLVIGVASVGDVRKLGRIGAKSFGYTIIVSSISVFIGLGLTNWLEPGKRISPETSVLLQEHYAPDAQKQMKDFQKSTIAETDSPLTMIVKSIVPKNPFAPVSGETPNMLQLMFVALVIGLVMTLLPKKRSEPLLLVLQSLYEVVAKIIDLVMHFAPYAVACLLFNNTAQFGFALLVPLAWFIGVVLLGLAIQMFGVYSASVYFLSKMSPITFFRRIKVIMLTAFSTSSSNATLPTALRLSEENLGVPAEINSFVLTVGATANQNGTALYEGVTVLFLAQLAGVDLTFGQQMMVVYLAIVGGIGTAGVPSGSIPFVMGILSMIHVSPALIAIILGVDRFLDMCRTTLNVTGDLTIATYVARSEGYKLK